MMGEMGTTCLAWLAAARDPGVVAALEAIFDQASEAIAARGPACWASGRCCNFEKAGHRLYTTGLEAAYTLVRAPAAMDTPLRPIAAPGAWRPWERGGLTLPQLEAARASGGCPFQRRNLCGVHAIKPVACRVYFCDRSAQAWQQELSERLHERVRGVHEAHGIPYLYAEWRGLLELLLESGAEGA